MATTPVPKKNVSAPMLHEEDEYEVTADLTPHGRHLALKKSKDAAARSKAAAERRVLDTLVTPPLPVGGFLPRQDEVEELPIPPRDLDERKFLAGEEEVGRSVSEVSTSVRVLQEQFDMFKIEAQENDRSLRALIRDLSVSTDSMQTTLAALVDAVHLDPKGKKKEDRQNQEFISIDESLPDLNFDQPQQRSLWADEVERSEIPTATSSKKGKKYRTKYL